MQIIHTYHPLRSKQRVTAFSFSRDERFLFCGLDDGKLFVYTFDETGKYKPLPELSEAGWVHM
jgi:hypothetical protein